MGTQPSPADLPFEAEHDKVLWEANQRYKSASMVRGQMWLDFPPSDKIRELRERVTRIERAYERLEHGGSHLTIPHLKEAIIEDAIDIINYSAFLVKQIRRGQVG